MNKLNLFILSSVLFSTSTFALDIDEKLTCRFLKLSNSKKTVLINRGAEDGLVVGDHAKFFITSGIIARGMVEKVSPSRSIWSLYRVVVPDELVDNKVVNLKIATPVKVTSDPSKSLKEEPIEVEDKSVKPSKEDQDAKDLEKISDKLSDEDNKELEEMGLKSTKKESKKVVPKETQSSKADVDIEENDLPVLSNSKRTFWEAYGTLSLNSMSGTYTLSSSSSNSTSAAASFLDFSIGIERNFHDSSSFLKKFSLFGIINKRSSEEGDQVKSTTDWFQYGGGLNYYFHETPTSSNKIIGYGTVGGGMGTTNISYKVDVSTTTLEDQPTKGTNNFLFIGTGAKYFVGSFGLRAELDYIMTKETFNFSDGTSKTRSLSGPKVQFGLNYRF